MPEIHLKSEQSCCSEVTLLVAAVLLMTAGSLRLHVLSQAPVHDVLSASMAYLRDAVEIVLRNAIAFAMPPMVPIRNLPQEQIGRCLALSQRNLQRMKEVDPTSAWTAAAAVNFQMVISGDHDQAMQVNLPLAHGKRNRDEGGQGGVYMFVCITSLQRAVCAGLHISLMTARLLILAG